MPARFGEDTGGIADHASPEIAGALTRALVQHDEALVLAEFEAVPRRLLDIGLPVEDGVWTLLAEFGECVRVAGELALTVDRCGRFPGRFRLPRKSRVHCRGRRRSGSGGRPGADPARGSKGRHAALSAVQARVRWWFAWAGSPRRWDSIRVSLPDPVDHEIEFAVLVGLDLALSTEAA